MLSAFIKENKLPNQFKNTAELYYKPLAHRIFKQYSENKQPFFVGVNGCQGSGKSTLTEFISKYLSSQYQLRIAIMSLDDFYLSSEKRNQLAHDIHPLLSTRGVPGTHDITALGLILTMLNQGETGFSIPRFDKATDEPFPKSHWTTIEEPIDIIILEGWCWGVKPQTNEQLKSSINELEFQHDSNGIWRHYVNEQLKKNYVPLYERMNFWLSLQTHSFDCVYKWRLEQEQKLAAKNVGRAHSKTMSPTELLNFTLYFQRLTEQGNRTLPSLADTVFFLDEKRNISVT
jgi:D-glycerate 3-kinase